MVKADFNRDVGRLGGFLKSNKIEKDPYKIIIIVERYVLKYGTAITKKTARILISGITETEKLSILWEIMQDTKPAEELTINDKKYGRITR